MAEDMLPMPSVCRMVHYRDDDNDRCIAAVITEVSSEELNVVSLLCFYPDDGEYAHPRKFAVPLGSNKGRTWHWPERV
jgi:hypothetical protein